MELTDREKLLMIDCLHLGLSACDVSGYFGCVFTPDSDIIETASHRKEIIQGLITRLGKSVYGDIKG